MEKYKLLCSETEPEITFCFGVADSIEDGVEKLNNYLSSSKEEGWKILSMKVLSSVGVELQYTLQYPSDKDIKIIQLIRKPWNGGIE